MPAPMKLQTLRKRREFLRVRGGGRWATPAFVLETKQRQPAAVAQSTDDQPVDQIAERLDDAPRVGFTVTKRLGNAVRRNRIRRRLKAAVQEVAQSGAKDHFDYVVIARGPSHDMTFADLMDLMSQAFQKVHDPARKSGRPRRKRPARGARAENSATQTTD